MTFDRGSGRRRDRGLGHHLRLGRARFEDLACEEQELGGVELLRLLAVKSTQELLELMLEFLVEMGLLPERLQQLADQPVGGLDIVGEWGFGADGNHTLSTHGARLRDKSSSLDYERSRTIQVARGAGRANRGSRRARLRSMPSRTAAISAGVTSTRPSRASGRRNTPFSSLLYQSAKPSRSQ